MPPDPTDAWETVRLITEAWRGGRVDDLAPWFHERAVIVDDRHAILADGRSACVESYRAFVTQATVEAYWEGMPEQRVVGPVAWMAYPFALTYRLGGAAHRESGSDALVLVWGGERWEVVWRQVVWRAVEGVDGARGARPRTGDTPGAPL